MLKDKTIIALSGLGYSGSGAVKDLLCEYSNVQIGGLGHEFQVLYFPDGIDDLDYHLNHSINRFYSSDVAIVRFLQLIEKLEREYGGVYVGKLYPMAKKYIDSITALTHKSFWAFDRISVTDNRVEKAIQKDRRVENINSWLRKINRIPLVHFPMLKYVDWGELYQKRDVYLSIKPSNFIDATKSFLDEMISLSIQDSIPYVVLDQFLPPNDPKRYYKYFDGNIKTIVVDRDPRDVYIFAKKRNVSFIPHQSVCDFNVWYRENCKPESFIEDENVLRIHFEDLIYHYDEKKSEIEQYIGINNPVAPKTKFNPEVSINNTQLWKKFSDMQHDCDEIVKTLPEFLYDFSKYTNFISNGHIF